MNLTVEIYSDVICPWCYIGKRRLEAAIALLDPSHSVRVHWLPYQLNPDMPKEGVSRDEYRIRKFGSLQRSKELDAKVAAAGAPEGIHFDFERMLRTPNTLAAHRLIWLAHERGIQDQVMEGLFRAYFTEGQDLSQPDVLIDISSQAGLDRAAAESLLQGDEGLDEIHEYITLSQQLGISGVPFFIVNHDLGLSGAQSPQTILAAFQHAIASH